MACASMPAPAPPTPRPLLLQVKREGRRLRLLALQAHVEERSAVVIQAAFRGTHVGRSYAANAVTEAGARGAPLVEQASQTAVFAAQSWVAEAEAQLEAAEKEAAAEKEVATDEVQEGAAAEVEAGAGAAEGAVATATAVAGAEVGAAAGVQRGAASSPQRRRRSLQSRSSRQALTPEWAHDLRVEIPVTPEQLEAGEGAGGGAGAAGGGAARAGANAITPSDSGTLSDVGTLSDPGTPPEAVTPPEGYLGSGRRHRSRTTSSASTRYSSNASPHLP